LDGQEEVTKAIDKLRNYGLDFVIPTDVIMADSFSYFIDREIDPYDAVAISVAIHEGVDVFVSRDGKLRRKTAGLLPVKEPEEL
jgi:predicted nucleic acid-binding protein